VKFSILMALFVTISSMQLLRELQNGVNTLLGCLYALVANSYCRCIFIVQSLCALVINLCDRFFFFIQVFVHHLVTKDSLFSQLAKLTDTPLLNCEGFGQCSSNPGTFLYNS
jgi:hypothetical protein